MGIGPYAGKTGEIFAAWKASIIELATCGNVTVKIGGLGMRINGYDFHEPEVPPSSDRLAEAWKPYIDTCIEVFGTDRCMFESNFPVDGISCSYTVLWNSFKRITAGFTESEKANLFRDTAERVYSIT